MKKLFKLYPVIMVCLSKWHAQEGWEVTLHHYSSLSSFPSLMTSVGTPTEGKTDKSVKLRSDEAIPLLGFGTYRIGNEEVASSVLEAFRAGYRHVDTAEGYNNEEGVGLGIKQALRELNLTRKDIFVTTKLWGGSLQSGGGPTSSPKDFEETLVSFAASLQRLQLDYVDLYLIHTPMAGREARLSQWKALLQLKAKGLARSVGVSNFSRVHLEEIAQEGLSLPDANQLELHPMCQQKDLVCFLLEKGITPLAYSSLAPLSTWRDNIGGALKSKEALAAAEAEDGPIKRIAKSRGVTEAQVSFFLVLVRLILRVLSRSRSTHTPFALILSLPPPQIREPSPICV
jgi:2,5-diketo-D-gluconate reductase A